MRARDLTKGNIAYHSELNPQVWDGTNLRIDVRLRLLEIAKKFIEYLEVPNFKLKDIILRGSLVNYNYTQYSDFDLHLVTNYEELGCDIAENFYMAKKRIWNDEHDITIKGYDVELYVEDVDAENVSAGTFSVLDNKWLRIPKREDPNIDERAVSAKARTLMAEINRARRSNDVDEIQRLQDKIKTMRKAGLDRAGEFSTENLAFKIVRNKGYLDKLYKAKTQAIDNELSLDEALQLAECGSWTVVEETGPVVIQSSNILDQSMSNKRNVIDKLKDFIEFKKANPTAPYGSSDTKFVSRAPLGDAIPKLRHAHLSHDFSVFYTVEGQNPTVLKLYGVFSHAESGTGHSPNIKRQKQLASTLRNK